MKKEYKKPMAEMIEFVPENDIMNGNFDVEDDDIVEGGSSVEEW